MKFIQLTIITLLAFKMGYTQENSDDILGIWWNPEKTTRIKVYKQQGQYFGEIVWIKDNTNPDGSSPKLDYNNENESLRDRPVLGSIVLKNLRWDNGEYDSGTLYDAFRGKTYSCYVEIKEDNTLSLYAYVLGMPFLNKRMTCCRYTED